MPFRDKSQWKACVRVNSFSKELSLSGVRYLQYERNRWQMSLPDKIINVPLRYELALRWYLANQMVWRNWFFSKPCRLWILS